METLIHLCLCRLLNSNKLTLIGDNAFTGLSHLQYLCVGRKGELGEGLRTDGEEGWRGRWEESPLNPLTAGPEQKVTSPIPLCVNHPA